jgi:hypothetical protein
MQAVQTDQLGHTESPSNGLLTSCSDGFAAMKDSSPGSAVVSPIEDSDSKVCSGVAGSSRGKCLTERLGRSVGIVLASIGQRGCVR